LLGGDGGPDRSVDESDAVLLWCQVGAANALGVVCKHAGEFDAAMMAEAATLAAQAEAILSERMPAGHPYLEAADNAVRKFRETPGSCRKERI
jgi:hypothetical protein